MLFFCKIICWALFAICAFTTPVHANEIFLIQNGKKRQQISITKSGSLTILKTFINNKGPFNFVLDSGVGLTIITDPSLKDSLNLPFIKKVEISGLGEDGPLNAWLAPSLKVNMDGIEAKKLGAVILEEKVPELSIQAGINIHGLIGYDFFSSFSVKTFFEDGYIVCRSKSASFKPGNGYMIPISLEKRKPYCTAEVEIEPNRIEHTKLIIDSGAEHALSLESKDNQEFPLPKKIIPAFLGMGLGGKINGFMGRIASLRIGELEIDNLLTSFPLYADVAEKVLRIIPRNGSLGGLFLRHYHVIYNYHQGYIFLEPTSPKFPLLEHDMSGIEISVSKDFKTFVVSKADLSLQNKTANVQKGDELVAIDQKPASTLKLEDIYSILRSGDGKNIRLRLKRKNEIVNTVIVLEKRI